MTASPNKPGEHAGVSLPDIAAAGSVGPTPARSNP